MTTLREACAAALALIENYNALESEYDAVREQLRAALAAPQPEFDESLMDPAKTRSDQTPQPEPVRYGCYCDLDPDSEPDGCVLDYDAPQDCRIAMQLQREGNGKTDCEYWRPIKFAASQPEPSSFERERERLTVGDVPQPEPVVYANMNNIETDIRLGMLHGHQEVRLVPSIYYSTALYAHPPRSYTPMTDEEIARVCRDTWSYDPYVIARATEDEVLRRLGITGEEAK